jgi:hypothetical protein
MAKKPETTEARAATPGNLLIAGLGAFRCPGPTSDPAVGGFEHSEFFLEQDSPMQQKLMAVKLDVEASVHRAVADGYANMAKAVKGG